MYHEINHKGNTCILLHLDDPNYKDIYEMELPYNTILSHLEKLVVNAKDYPDFQKKQLVMLGLSDGSYGDVDIQIDRKDRELGDSLGLTPVGKVGLSSDLVRSFVPEGFLKSGNNIPRLKQLWENFR